jgi:hypothetical protein
MNQALGQQLEIRGGAQKVMMDSGIGRGTAAELGTPAIRGQERSH